MRWLRLSKAWSVNFLFQINIAKLRTADLIPQSYTTYRQPWCILVLRSHSGWIQEMLRIKRVLPCQSYLGLRFTLMVTVLISRVSSKKIPSCRRGRRYKYADVWVPSLLAMIPLLSSGSALAMPCTWNILWYAAAMITLLVIKQRL